MAKYLFEVYVALTVLCALAYHLAGMHWFEAINHAMTTLSTGGYSTSDSSMSAFSPAAHWVAIVFMAAGGLPLLMFVQSIQQKTLKIWNDEQVKGFIKFIILVSLTLGFWLWLKSDMALLDAMRLSGFNVISVVTTTGYGLTDYQAWGAFASICFLFLMFAGSCSGSTSGGIKIFRFQISLKVMHQQLIQQVHPQAVVSKRYNNRVIDNDIIRSIMAFIMLFLIVIILLAVTLVLTGLDPVTSISGAITAVTKSAQVLGLLLGLRVILPVYRILLNGRWLLECYWGDWKLLPWRYCSPQNSGSIN